MMRNQKPLLFTIALAVILFCAVFFGQNLFPTPDHVSTSPATSTIVVAVSAPKQENAVVALPLPHSTLPIGSQTYQIMSGNAVGPHIIQATINPPDVDVGNVQNLSVIVSSAASISSVTALIKTDHGTTTVPLSFARLASAADILPLQYAVDDQGTVVPASSIADNSQGNILERFIHATFGEPAISSASSSPTQNYVYTGRWTVRDTHNIYYHTTFVAEDAKGLNNSVTLAWSDACGIPQSGAWTISANCDISSLTGVQGGNATISGYTLTLNAQFAFTPGNSIHIGTGGSIAMGSGGSLSQGYLYWQTSNGYACPGFSVTPGPFFSAASSWSGHELQTAVTFSTTLNGWPNVGTGEGDNAVVPTVFCGVLGSGYVSNDECDELDSSVFPGQTAWFTTPDGIGNYDYNCTGVTSYEYPTLTISGQPTAYCADAGLTCNPSTYPLCADTEPTSGLGGGIMTNPGCGGASSQTNPYTNGENNYAYAYLCYTTSAPFHYEGLQPVAGIYQGCN